MDEMSGSARPSDPVSIGVLVVTAMGPLSMDGILGALAHIGAPTWQPVGEVIVEAVDRLHRQRLLDAAAGDRGDLFAPSAVARAALPKLLDALPLAGASPDIAYKLKVMGLDLLEPAERARQIEALVGHWRGLAHLWQSAEDHCPCTQPSVRAWMKHNLNLARSEVDWLGAMASAGQARDIRAPGEAGLPGQDQNPRRVHSPGSSPGA